jgi:hypothetical protein
MPEIELEDGISATHQFVIPFDHGRRIVPGSSVEAEHRAVDAYHGSVLDVTLFIMWSRSIHITGVHPYFFKTASQIRSTTAVHPQYEHCSPESRKVG